ncbi:hypothetical protein BX667DRAFT_507988 [Coemansia mojavensis]|nr:hypothetical protein BX667DRAFT_507988 [Coemansia mojavensis]
MPPKTNLDTTRLSTIVEDYAAQGPITRSRAKQLAAAAIPQPDPTKEKRGITARLRPSARKADAADAADAADMAATPPRSSLVDAGSAFPINPAEAQLAVQMGQVAIDNVTQHSESPEGLHYEIAPSTPIKSSAQGVLGHAQKRTPLPSHIDRQKLQTKSAPTYENAKSSRSLQHAQSPTSGRDNAWSNPEQESIAIVRKKSDLIAQSSLDISLDQMLAMTNPTRSTKKQITKTVDEIASEMEDIFSSDSDRYKFTEWPGTDSLERVIYGYFSEFVLFVAERVKERHLDTSGWQMVLPSRLTDYKPSDSNTTERLDVSLFLEDMHKEAAALKESDYADMFAIVEVKRRDSPAEINNALSQLFCYSQNIYINQLNRRFLWGLTIWGSHVCAEVMVHDKVLVSSTMDIRKAEGRKQLVSLLVHWSACSTERLGYDPSMRRRELTRVADFHGAIDKTIYDIDCYDDATGKTRTYTTIRTILEASCLFGRHTRTIIARPEDAIGDSSQEVVIKDAWAHYNANEDYMRNEIGLLRTVHETLKDRQLDFIYPKLEVGGTVKLNGATDDTTAAILNTLDKWETLKIPFRVHRRIVTTPVGHSMKVLADENELVIVLAEAMRCHQALVNDCGILHRDISLGNILVVGTGPNHDELHGLLIDLDSAIRTDGVERTAGAERSGTLPYMSIANLENLDMDHTALDDWESLLYVVCWVATYGVVSEDRRDPNDDIAIKLWNADQAKAAEAKRGHMDSSRSFEGDIIKHFLPQYRLLEELAKGLHQILFLHPECEGARFKSTTAERRSLLNQLKPSKNVKSLPTSDPLLKRSKYMNEIVSDLSEYLALAEKVARENLAN